MPSDGATKPDAAPTPLPGADPGGGTGERDVRRAAALATCLTIPLVVLCWLVVARLSSQSSNESTDPARWPPVSVSAPPLATAESESCTQVLEKLPIALSGLPPRRVAAKPATPFVVAWGNPAVILSCGVRKPRDMVPGSSTQLFTVVSLNGPYFEVTKSNAGYLYTIVDRKPFIALFVPREYVGGPYMPTAMQAVAEALPAAVCTTSPDVSDPSDLCSHR